MKINLQEYLRKQDMTIEQFTAELVREQMRKQKISAEDVAEGSMTDAKRLEELLNGNQKWGNDFLPVMACLGLGQNDFFKLTTKEAERLYQEGLKVNYSALPPEVRRTIQNTPESRKQEVTGLLYIALQDYHDGREPDYTSWELVDRVGEHVRDFDEKRRRKIA